MKLTLTFKGREMQFQEIGKDLFKVGWQPFAIARKRLFASCALLAQVVCIGLMWSPSCAEIC